MEYTEKQLRVIYKALKGANLLGTLQTETECSRNSIFNTFNAPDIQHIDSVVTTAITLLKDNGILNDIQTLTEIIN